MVQGLGSRVQGSGFTLRRFRLRVQDSRFTGARLGSRVQGSGFRVQGSGFRVQVEFTLGKTWRYLRSLSVSC